MSVLLALLARTGYANNKNTDIQSKKRRHEVVWTLQGYSEPVLQPNKHPTVGRNEKNSTIPSTSSPVTLNCPQPTNNDEGCSDSTKLSQDLKGDPIRNHVATNLSQLRPPDGRDSKLYGEGEIIHKVEPRPRKYHLTYDTFPGLKRQPSFTGGIRKRRKPQRDHLAVFVETERGEKLVEGTIRDNGQSGQGQFEDFEKQDSINPVGASNPMRKRPNVSAAERAWRSKTWGKQNADVAKRDSEGRNQPATNWDDTSILLAQELQDFAMEQSQTQSSHALSSQLKFKPKPPGPRRAAGKPVDVNTESNPATPSVHDGDVDYVVDTYLRVPLRPLGMDAPFETYHYPLQDIDRRKVGLLVIEEEQETLWETFGDEHKSESESNSDVEDENGLVLPNLADVRSTDFTSRGLLWE